MGSPLALTSRTYAERAWQAYREFSSFAEYGVNLVHGEATRVNVKDKVITYADDSKTHSRDDVSREMPYDYLIVSTGLGRTWPASPVRATKQEYIVDAERYSRELANTEGPIGIVGGGKSAFS